MHATRIKFVLILLATGMLVLVICTGDSYPQPLKRMKLVMKQQCITYFAFIGLISAQSEIQGILKNAAKTASDTKFVSAQDNSSVQDENGKTTKAPTIVTTTTTTTTTTTPTVTTGKPAVFDSCTLLHRLLNAYTHPISHSNYSVNFFFASNEIYV